MPKVFATNKDHLSETIQSYDSDVTGINSNYHIYRQDRVTGTGGGVLIAVRNTIPSRQVWGGWLKRLP